MNRLICGWIVWLFLCWKLGFGQEAQSTRIWSLGGAGLSVNGQVSVFDPPASVAFLSNFQIESFIYTPLSLPEFQWQAMGMGLGWGKGGVGLGFQRRGINSAFSELHSHITLSRRFGPYWGVGLRWGTQSVWVRQYPKAHKASLSLSSNWQIHPLMWMGVHLGPMDMNSKTVRSSLDIPISFHLDYRWAKHIQTMLMMKTEPHHIAWAIGSEIQVGPFLQWRMGWANQPIRPLIGLGWNKTQWELDCGIGYYSYLGWISQWGIRYKSNMK
jgi:hypothetical protein